MVDLRKTLFLINYFIKFDVDDFSLLWIALWIKLRGRREHCFSGSVQNSRPNRLCRMRRVLYLHIRDNIYAYSLLKARPMTIRRISLVPAPIS